VVHNLGSQLERKTGLSHPAGAGQRHEPVLAEKIAQAGDLTVATHKGRHLSGEVVGNLRVIE